MTRRPKLRPDIVFRRLTSREEAYVIVKDPVARKYYQFEEWEYDLLQLLDGTRDVDDLARELGTRSPEYGDAQYVADYVEELRRLDLLEKTDRERFVVMADRAKEQRKSRLYQTTSIFQVHFPMFDPDRFMNRVIKWIRWWWSPWFVGLSLVAFVLILGFLTQHWDMYWAGFLDLWKFNEKTTATVVGFLFLLFAVSVWHEMGHGLTCKRFGGEVHDIGIMLFYLSPMFYCGIDDSYLFPKRSHRIWAALGGPYFELLLCSGAAVVWLLTPAEWASHQVALTIVFLTGLGAVMFNLNPFIKFDAYYVLMDWLDVPNLREESFRYIGNLLKEHVFRLKVTRGAISRRRRRIYLVYGTVSVIYTGLLISLLYAIFRGWMVSWLGPAGYLVALGVVGYMFRRPALGFVRFSRHFVLDKRERLRTGRGRVAIGTGLVVGVALLTLVRCPMRIEGEFVVVPAERAAVRAPTAGLIRSIDVTEGSRVSEGQVLGTLVNPDLAADERLAKSDLALATRRLAEARRIGDLASAREWAERARGAEGHLRRSRDKLEELVLRSPMDGVVSTSGLEDRVGGYLDKGATLLLVDRLDTVKLDVPMPELQIGEIRDGMPVRVLATALPWRPFRARLLSVAPVAVAPEPDALDVVRRTHLVRLQVEVPNPEGWLRPGMTGRVQVLGRERSLAGQAWWRLRRWVASLIW